MRHSHAPAIYICPFCLVVAGIENEHVLTVQADIVQRTPTVTAFIASSQWPRNQGHVVVIPNDHIENMYTLPRELAADIHETARLVALAMKLAYECDGISTRQHNEPHGDQEVWHYHLHVFPRWQGDNLYGSNKASMPASDRASYAEQLREALKKVTPL